MEASDTEWTNQASIAKWGGDWLFFYHDDNDGGTRNRMVHGECFTFDPSSGDMKALDYATGAMRELPIPRTAGQGTAGLNCAVHYPFALKLILTGKGSGSVSGTGNKSCTSGTCTWAYLQQQQVTLAGKCSGTYRWSGCSAASGSTCYVKMSASKSVTFTCN